jgi:hypothetical protein
MAPLPPRPKDSTKVTNDSEKHVEHLSERTLLEQDAGKQSIEQSKLRLEQEQEAGRKSVELNEQRARQR